ncbi:uncharacterized protein LOC126744770 [Anthonomus grandis grandis]|uniref:uncharacterized protein LOC126744770 n=1 Tax=Anthonomus grandis grandis TaxID=2921223 RepID=UPI002166B042|nr:uncharacterized protein LOC126744770 [Anthonomus grandis grandis]
MFLGKGQRLIICHIGSKDGFVPGGLWVFQSKKTGDYHEEMDGPSFEKWFEGVLPKLEENAVVVLDNAPYHSRKLEKVPTTATKKGEIQEWLRSKNLSYEEAMIKAQLLKIVNENKSQFNLHIIDEMAKASGRTVLRLPAYHCKLNPIELIWAKIKGYVASHNTTFKFADMRKIFEVAVSRITPENWQKCIEHTNKVENKMWDLDNIMDVQVERLVIPLNGSDTSSS